MDLDAQGDGRIQNFGKILSAGGHALKLHSQRFGNQLQMKEGAFSKY